MKNPMASRGTQQESAKKKMAYFRRFWVKGPRHSENVFDRKRYILIWRISDYFGLRGPVIQKTFSPERGIPQYGVFTMIWG